MRKIEIPRLRARNLVAKSLSIGFAAVLGILALAPTAAAQVQIVDPWPGACSNDGVFLRPTTVDVPTVGTSLEVSWTAAGLASKKVLIVVNGNSYVAEDYDALVGHLVSKDYVVANALRPNGGPGGDAQYVVDVVGEVLAAAGLDPEDPEVGIGLIGHSKGGQLVIEAAAANLQLPDPYPIFALMTLAPKAFEDAAINAFGMPAFLSIYGSQDEDVKGYENEPREAFRAYDQMGSELSTTCNFPPCVQTTPSVDKTTIYVQGADHSGLIGIGFHPPGDDLGLEQENDYLSPEDTLCLVKAYTTAFAHWQLKGDDSFKGFLRDEWRPFSLLAMGTAEADGFGNGPGAPIDLQFQISPKQRRVIRNFEGGDGSPDRSPEVGIEHVLAGHFEDPPYHLRSFTDAVFVAWPVKDYIQYARWAVSPFAEVASTYTHFSIRIGQMQGMPPMYSNTPGVDRTVWIGLVDQNGETESLFGTVPYADEYLGNPGGWGRSVMTTLRFPVRSLNPEMDLDNIRWVYLIFAAGTQGTYVVDSIEWHRD